MTLKKLSHTFAYEQLSYEVKPNEQPYIKLSFFFSKLDSVSYEHFHRHWQTIHADLTIGTKAFHTNRIQRYVQLHAYPDLKQKVTDAGMEPLDYDGCSEIYVRRFEDWTKFASSEEFQKALLPDAENMGMKLPFKVMASYENVIYGSALTSMGGTDGITEQTPRADGK